MANTATMNNNTTVLNNGMTNIVMNNTNENERNNKMETITNNTTLNNETITNTNELNENELEAVLEEERIANGDAVLIDTLFDDIETEKKESRTWNEPYFLDRTGASQELKEWANLVSEMFWRRNEVGYNNHPDWTVVSVPTRFRDEVRALMEGNPLPYSPGMVVHPGVWYYPADREFEIVE